MLACWCGVASAASTTRRPQRQNGPRGRRRRAHSAHHLDPRRRHSRMNRVAQEAVLRTLGAPGRRHPFHGTTATPWTSCLRHMASRSRSRNTTSPLPPPRRATTSTEKALAALSRSRAAKSSNDTATRRRPTRNCSRFSKPETKNPPASASPAATSPRQHQEAMPGLSPTEPPSSPAATVAAVHVSDSVRRHRGSLHFVRVLRGTVARLPALRPIAADARRYRMASTCPTLRRTSGPAGVRSPLAPRSGIVRAAGLPRRSR